MSFKKVLWLLLMITVYISGITTLKAAPNPDVLIKTNYGTITVELDPVRAPITVKNFLDYVNAGFYTNTLFHRVIPDFMIQGGGYTLSMQEKKTNAPIQVESNNGLKNVRGSIAMARTNEPNSATSQFYINLVDNDFLDYQNNSTQGVGYTVFGQVIQGMETVDSIAKAQTKTSHGMPDVPSKPVIIESITISK